MLPHKQSCHISSSLGLATQALAILIAILVISSERRILTSSLFLGHLHCHLNCNLCNACRRQIRCPARILKPRSHSSCIHSHVIGFRFMVVLQLRCEEIGLAESIIQRLVDPIFDTYAKIAGCSNHIPGTKDEAVFAESIRSCVDRAPQSREQAFFGS